MLYANIALTFIAGFTLAGAVQLMVIRKLLSSVLGNAIAMRLTALQLAEKEGIDIDANILRMEVRETINDSMEGTNWIRFSWPLDAVVLISAVLGAIWLASHWELALEFLWELTVFSNST